MPFAIMRFDDATGNQRIVERSFETSENTRQEALALVKALNLPFGYHS